MTTYQPQTTLPCYDDYLVQHKSGYYQISHGEVVADMEKAYLEDYKQIDTPLVVMAALEKANLIEN